jgi:hypothetical protein
MTTSFRRSRSVDSHLSLVQWPTDVGAEEPTVPDRPAQRAETGLLIVDAPAGARVFVNGIARGVGVVSVPDLDRHARHILHIAARDHVPWTGSACLDGKTVARVRPSLLAVSVARATVAALLRRAADRAEAGAPADDVLKDVARTNRLLDCLRNA